ncbi:MAG: hypothetical protein WCI49_10115 [Ferruginibacter sp.]
MKGKVDKLLGRYREKDGITTGSGDTSEIDIISSDASVVISEAAGTFDLSANKPVLELFAANETELVACWATARASGKSARIYIVGVITLTANRNFAIARGEPLISIVGYPRNTIAIGAYLFSSNTVTFENIDFSVASTNALYLHIAGYITLKNVRFISDRLFSDSPKTHIHIAGAASFNTGEINIDGVTHYSDVYATNEDDTLQPLYIYADSTCTDYTQFYINIKNMAAVKSYDRFSRILIKSETNIVPFKVTGDETWFYHSTQEMIGNGTMSAVAEILKNSSLDNCRVDLMPVDTTMERIVGIGANKKMRQIPKADFLADVNLQLSESNAYGVRINTAAATSSATRIGNLTNHVLLPVQSKMRRCALDDAGNVIAYLLSSDSKFKADGSPFNFDGSAGQLMVEIPDFWYKAWQDGLYYNILISDLAITGYTKVNKHYIGAFKASLQRSTLKLSSCLNETADFRGGGNQAAWDGFDNTMLGKPVTDLSLTNFRNYARNRGARYQAMPFSAHNALNMLYLVEFANSNSQLPINSALTSEGYRQGGIGAGVTQVDGTNWNTFCGYYPLIPCGNTLSMGNATGKADFIINGFPGGNITVPVNSYRGIENPFGDIWEWSDGILFDIQAVNAGSKSLAYVCDIPANYADAITANYRLVGQLSRVDGWIYKMIGGAECIMLPGEMGGDSNTYWSDYGYVANIPANGSNVTGLLISASANSGSAAGLWCASTYYAPSSASAYFGSRLCFL